MYPQMYCMHNTIKIPSVLHSYSIHTIKIIFKKKTTQVQVLQQPHLGVMKAFFTTVELGSYSRHHWWQEQK